MKRSICLIIVSILANSQCYAFPICPTIESIKSVGVQKISRCNTDESTTTKWCGETQNNYGSEYTWQLKIKDISAADQNESQILMSRMLNDIKSKVTEVTDGKKVVCFYNYQQHSNLLATVTTQLN